MYVLSMLKGLESFVVAPNDPSSKRLWSTPVAQGTEINQIEQQINGESKDQTEKVSSPDQGEAEEKRSRPNNYRSRQSNTRINNQDKYGVSLELPKTYIKCGRCSTCFAIQPEDLGNGKGW